MAVCRLLRRPAVALALMLCAMVPGLAQEQGILNLGDAVVTGFSGVRQPDILDTASDETLIDPDGISARINSLAAPAYVWDGRVWPAETARSFAARDVGQVFGVALDDAARPNIYFTATSAYGLHITAADSDNDGRAERLKQGRGDAQWMAGMWGTADAAGGPGSIWKADGATGAVTLFATLRFKGEDNAGAGLGNIAYDSAHKQLFVSDLATGMIHSFALDGQERDVYDHGVTGRSAANLAPVPHDAANRLDITSPDFDSEDPESWGYAEEDRRVWGLNAHGGRLYYAVVGDSQIWSVGLEELTGRFMGDARWELDVPKKPKQLAVTDMLFTHKGAMLLAQRGEIKSTYDYSNFADTGKSRLYRYWREDPDNVNTPSPWIEKPEEYAVGFEVVHRATNGGIDLNHGYTADGYLDSTVCESTLWSTGDNLRNNMDLKDTLLPGGALLIDGLQGMPAGPVKDENTPPWASYMVDNDPGNTESALTTPVPYSDTAVQGWIGDVAVYRVGCDGGSGQTAGYWGGSGYPWSDPPYITEGGGGGGGEEGGEDCTPGVDCPEPPPSCARPKGGFVCDTATGTWAYTFDANSDPALNANWLKVTGMTPGISVSNGPELPLGTPTTALELSGIFSGQIISLNLCIFNKAAMQSGKPFDCCKTTVTLRAPAQACVKN